MKMDGGGVDGLPWIAWVQETPETGRTLGGLAYRWIVISATVLGSVVGLILALIADDLGPIERLAMLIGGPLWGAGLSALLGLGALSLRDPVLSKQHCRLQIVRRNDDLLLAYSLKGEKKRYAFEVPLAEVAELVLGDSNEWFGTKGYGNKLFETMVIVMPLPDGRVYHLVDHVGTQAEMTGLHSLLSEVFIQDREGYLRQLTAEKRAALCSESGGTPKTL